MNKIMLEPHFSFFDSRFHAEEALVNLFYNPGIFVDFHLVIVCAVRQAHLGASPREVLTNPIADGNQWRSLKGGDSLDDLLLPVF